MSNSKRPKAFFLNGGMGRIISAIPALEKYYESKEDPDFIIVIEGICIKNAFVTSSVWF